MTPERKYRPMRPMFYVEVKRLLNMVECPHGCDASKIVAKLENNGEDLFVYCNQCGTIVYNSRAEEEMKVIKP